MNVKTPLDLGRLRAFFDSVNWTRLEAEIAGEARSRVVIVGPVNCGKSTLFNLLKGTLISAVSAVPGTTQTAVAEHFGPFTLVDTPGFSEVGGEERAKIAHVEIDQANLVILLLDAGAGVRQTDLDLYARIQAAGIPTVVALNKIDLVRRDLRAVLQNLTFQLQGTAVVPISAHTGAGVVDKLIPAIVRADEAVAVVVGRALPAYRAAAAKRVINSAAGWALLLGVEPLPGLDLPLLLGMQARMILRLAAIYGENFSTHHARELLTTIVGSLTARYVGMELAKLVPGVGWVVSGIIAALATLGMGKAAEAYFRSGRRLAGDDLRLWVKYFLRRPPAPPLEIELPPADLGAAPAPDPPPPPSAPEA